MKGICDNCNQQKNNLCTECWVNLETKLCQDCIDNWASVKK